MDTIKIHTLTCGTMHVRPKEAFLGAKAFPSGRIELPVNVYLIEHPVHGRILLDTGWSADCRRVLNTRLLHFYEPRILPGQTAREQLAQRGLKPEDIDVVLLSHLDVDHTCALKDFAGKAGRIVCAELEYFYSCRYVYKMRQVWDTWMPYADRIERIHYHGSSLGPTGRGFDLFGDDSVLCIYCPGHTDGIFATIVSQSPSDRFHSSGDGLYGGPFAVLGSDIAFSQRNLTEGVVPGYGFDRGLQLKSMRFLEKLQADPQCRGLLLSHDPQCMAELEL